MHIVDSQKPLGTGFLLQKKSTYQLKNLRKEIYYVIVVKMH